MAQCLPVTADGTDGRSIHSRVAHQLQRAAREGLCHGNVDLADFIQRNSFRSIDEGGNPAFESRLEGLGTRGKQRQR